MALVEIFTDGSSLTNPGDGGYAAILRWKDAEKVVSGHAANTTNNRMELMAAIAAIEALKRPCEVLLYTDSQYVQKGANEYIVRWKRENFKGVKNEDLWKRLDAAVQGHKIQWIWVRGHNGHVENERVDKLARRAAIAGRRNKVLCLTPR